MLHRFSAFWYLISCDYETICLPHLVRNPWGSFAAELKEMRVDSILQICRKHEVTSGDFKQVTWDTVNQI